MNAPHPIPAIQKMPCRACNGKGENEYMGLTDTQFIWSDCIECEGSGVEAPYCLRCDETLTADLFCVSCDEFASREYVDRVAPLPVGWNRVEL